MIGLIIIAHTNLAEALVNTIEHILGPQKNVVSIGIGESDSVDNKYSDLLAAINKVDQGAGVIIVTDMFGGTPSNLAVSVLGEQKIEVIAGVNVPLLLKFFQLRTVTLPLSEIAFQCQDCGQKYIKVASALLGSNRQNNNNYISAKTA